MTEDKAVGVEGVVSPGGVSTPGEWRVQISMKMEQIAGDVTELREDMKGLAAMERNIQADIKLMHQREARITNLESATGSLEKSYANMNGQFKVVTAILSLALASLFGWVFTKGPSKQTVKPPPIIIKIDKSLVQRASGKH